MKILRVGDVGDNRTGGFTRFMHFIADELRAAGHQVDVWFSDRIGLPRVGPRWRRFAVPLRIAQLVRRAAARGNAYDVVEIHEPSAAAYCAARRLDPTLPPAVVTSYGVESRCRRAMLAYLGRRVGRPTLKQRYGGLLTVTWQADFALRHADHVTVETAEDVEYVTRRLGVLPRRVTVVNGGVTRAFLDCPDGPSPGRGVLFLASWIDRKGVPDVVPALTRLLRDRPGTTVTVAGCGLPADRVRADFPADVRGALRVVPKVEGESALLDEYRRHAVFLTPSVFEGQLLTMLEASAAGLAVVGTNTCGMKDFVADGVSGLLVPVGDPDRLHAAAARLIDDPALAARLGAEAQRRARHYTWGRSAEQFLAAARAAGQCRRRRGRGHQWA